MPPKILIGIKRKPLTLEMKLNIIKVIDSNPHKSRVAIAKQLDLPPSTINTVYSRRSNLLAISKNKAGGTKKIKSSKYDKIDEKVLQWMKETRSSNIPISGPIIRQKAEEIALRLCIPFTASNGWIERLKNRSGIKYKTVRSESSIVVEKDVASWQNVILPSLIKGYEPKNIFNCDECGLFYRLLPNKTSAFKGDKCFGGKQSEERLTVLVGSNMDGSEKLPLLLIGKSKRPTAFKNSRSLPCQWESNKSAWMTCDIFERYMQKLDARMRLRNRKIIMFIDHCDAHPKDYSRLRNIRVEFLPANATSRLQPMDQGIIHALKQGFRKRLVAKVLHCVAKGDKKSIKNISLVDAMHFIAAAWGNVSKMTLANCFRKAGFGIASASDDDEEVDDPESSDTSDSSAMALQGNECPDSNDWNKLQGELGFESTFEEFVTFDNELLTCQLREYSKKTPPPRYEDISLILPKIRQKTEIKCRLCMGVTKTTMICLFKNPLPRSATPAKATLASKILSVTGLTVVEGDGLPEHICQPCNRNIVNWYEFKKVCLASDAKYRLKKYKTKKKGRPSSQDNLIQGESTNDSGPEPSQFHSDVSDVKVEIEEHSVYESAAASLRSASMYKYQDAERSPQSVIESTTIDETAPPQFVNVKLEQDDSDGVWNPDSSLADMSPSDVACASSVQIEKRFADNGTTNTDEMALTDPLSITSSHDVAVTSTISVPIPSVPVINPPTISLEKSSSYLLAMQPLTTSMQGPSTYVLAFQKPTVNTRDTFQAGLNVSNNVPFIANAAIPSSATLQDSKEPNSVRKRHYDTLEDDYIITKFKHLEESDS